MGETCLLAMTAKSIFIVGFKNMIFKVIEKNNPLAVHAHCCTLESAKRWITVNAPEYCAKGYFMDKTLTPDSFTILECK